jgi:8-oxo-dGTP pyrophosphatase MutT (NUDIX family)
MKSVSRIAVIIATSDFVRSGHSFIFNPSITTTNRQVHGDQREKSWRSVSVLDKLFMGSSSTENDQPELPEMHNGLQRFVSLAASYRVDISSGKDSETWSLTPISKVKGVTDNLAEGVQAKRALHADESSPPLAMLRCARDGDILAVDIDISDVKSSLVAALSRIMVQRLASRQDDATKEWTVSLPEESSLVIDNLFSEAGVLELFEPILDTSNVELIDMVDREGIPLGSIPRPLVHTFNILHRGVGVVVAKDARIVRSGMTEFPDLYVHRRTATKRIFPSLYDMFVGGVSSAGEDARNSAAREIAEELGLTRALTDPSALSGPLFHCTVYTSYNRCVVTVFCYTFDSSQDSIEWQEEEVAWGAFVPYSIIMASARLAIQRMVSLSCYWPGESPYSLTLETTSRPSGAGFDSVDWITWDYVPDGLLVWEAWLKWQNNAKDHK